MNSRARRWSVACAVVIGVFAVVFRATVGAALPPQAVTVEDIVARNLAAKGGAEKLRAVTSVKMAGRVKGPAGETPTTSWAKRPTRCAVSKSPTDKSMCSVSTA